jgi:hypothetical protein
MTKDNSGDPRLSKFSNANRRAYQRAEDGAPLDDDPPLANLLETAIRDRALPNQAPLFQPDQGSSRDGEDAEAGLSARLIEELKAAQEQIRAAPSQETPASMEEPPPSPFELAAAQAPIPEVAYSEGRDADGEPAILDLTLEDAALDRPVRQSTQAAGTALAKGAKAALAASGKLSRNMRLRDWRRRRLALLSVVHRHVFDRNAERLLFCKSPPLEVYRVEETEAGPETSYVYRGPIPKKLLEWTLSALPEDLKRYAFVDFRAGNGRTLLLAARRNFEYAAGYAFDDDGSETLEMNLAQYPRSYLSCRDVRALRADRDGIVIPPQPAVLFFPDNLSATHLDIILSYVLGSFRLDPRDIYLIFENAGRERGRAGMEIFERAPIPVLNRAKALLFGPVEVAVYRSKVENPEKQAAENAVSSWLHPSTSSG